MNDAPCDGSGAVDGVRSLVADRAALPLALQGRKRSAIFAGARSVFLRDGLSGSNMDDVALAAGLSKPTVYRHFGSKGKLFEGLLEDMCGGKYATQLAGVRSL